MNIRTLFLAVIGLFLVSPLAHAGTVTAKGQIKNIHVKAVGDPFDPAKFNAYLGTLPTVKYPGDVTYYVVEGDLLMTRDEVQVHLAAASTTRAKPGTVLPELIVNLNNGRPDYWDLPQRRTLTYAVDQASFPTREKYDQVVANMHLATRDWENACPDCAIHFVHRSDIDGNPSHDKVTFIVRNFDSGGNFIAAAFFPSYPVFRRFLDVDPSYFATRFDRTGVLRHELGHILGYRHEHTRDVSGCNYEDNEWKPLTDYDPHSVMHYICGDGGTHTLELTDIDVAGHRTLYRVRAGALAPNVTTGLATPPIEQSPGLASPSAATRDTLTVRFEGGLIAENLLSVMSVLIKSGVVKTREYKVMKGDNTCDVYRREMGFPDKVRCAREKMLGIAAELNGGKPSQYENLAVGQTLKVPETFNIRTYTFTKKYDLHIEKDRRKLVEDKAGWNIHRAPEPESKSITRIQFEGYEIRLAIPDVAEARRVLKQLHLLNSANIYSNLTKQPFKERFPHYWSYSSNEHLRHCRTRQADVGEGWYSMLSSISEVPQCALTCQNEQTCARIILIDKPVHRNPDINAAIVEGGRPLKSSLPPTAGVPGNDQFCREINFEKDKHHGTHLAGIMVSQPNGFGFVGLSPAARLHSLDRDEYTDETLADLIEERSEASQHPKRIVFVFASSFEPFQEYDIKTKTFKLKDPELRFSRKTAARYIRNNRPLWISAVGQADPVSMKDPIEIFLDSPLSPMNLGDLPNVILVTACDDCSDHGAKLLTDAHFSVQHKLVHIAAPGKAIAGLADETSITEASGTSQAAAYVGGVAAGMVSCFPNFYNDGAAVKKRLQTTARPVLADEDSMKVQSGIVDVALALLDPYKHWIKIFGSVHGLSEAEIEGWCARSFPVVDAFNRDKLGEIESRYVRRITRYRRAEPGEPERWVIFGDVGKAAPPDQFTRIGPGKLAGSVNILKLKTSTMPMSVVSVGQIEELVIGPQVKRVVKCD